MHSEQEIDGAIKQISGGRVLDIATGGGFGIRWMQDALQDWQDFTGIDTKDQPANPEVEFNGSSIRYLKMNAHQLDFPDATFDTTLICSSIHHMAEPRTVLSEMVRVLKPGGHLIISEMVCNDLTNQQQTHMLLHHWWGDIDRALGVDHHSTYSRDHLVEMVNELGLTQAAFYDFASQEGDPHDPEQTAFLRSRIDLYLDRAKDLPEYAAFQARGEELSRRLDEVGFRSATTLIVIGQK